MDTNRYPFEPIDDALTDERVPFMPAFYGAIIEIEIEEDELPTRGMTDDEYNRFLAGGHK